MTLLNPSQGDMQHAIKDALKLHWRLFLFQGVIMIILGILAIVAPVVATVVVDLFVGWLFLISGVVGLIAIFSAHDIPAFLWSLVTAALSLAVGVLLIWKPAAGAMSLTLLLIAFFVAEGVFQTVTSLAYRDIMAGTWGWMLVSGISDLALAVIIIIGWPISAAWAIGVIVGVNLITSGWGIVMVAVAGRKFAQELEQALGGPAAAARH
jgi:uncharacterized membrane protein HdeD (DUF308 family)